MALSTGYLVFLTIFFFLVQSRAKTIIVDRSGHGDYTRIQDAIDSVPSGNSKEVLIFIRPGIYKEQVIVREDKPFITLTGKKAKNTIITSNGEGLLKSATLAVFASDFMAHSLTIQNTRGPGSVAVALTVSGERVAFEACRILSSQDTLLDGKGKHYYKNCYIEGAADFICGDASSVFEGCHVHSTSEGYSWITAQLRTSPSEDNGFLFFNCKITGAKSKSTMLGRPWGDYSKVIFAHTYMSNVILPQGWDDWGDSSKQSTVYYGEYECYGPGANNSKRVSWAHKLSTQEVKPYLTNLLTAARSYIRPISTHFNTLLTPSSSRLVQDQQLISLFN